MDSPYYSEYDIIVGAYIVRGPWCLCINIFTSDIHAIALVNLLNGAYQAGQQSKMQERLSEDVYA
jgi:hypothetical protein